MWHNFLTPLTGRLLLIILFIKNSFPVHAVGFSAHSGDKGEHKQSGQKFARE